MPFSWFPETRKLASLHFCIVVYYKYIKFLLVCPYYSKKGVAYFYSHHYLLQFHTCHNSRFPGKWTWVTKFPSLVVFFGFIGFFGFKNMKKKNIFPQFLMKQWCQSQVHEIWLNPELNLGSGFTTVQFRFRRFCQGPVIKAPQTNYQI